MTTQSHNPVPPIDPAQIAAIWEAHKLGSLRQIVPALGGVRNTSYFVNDDLVLRFNTRDPGFVKFGNERIAYAMLAGSGLMVPQVVALDETRTLVPWDFIVLTRLPGVTIAASRATLTVGEIHTLAWQAGSQLARLHHYTFPAFGKLHQLAHQPFRSWQSYFDDYVQRYLNAARQAKLIDDALYDRLTAVQQRSRELLARVTQAVLVHSDFHYENLLQQNGELCGLLDFEWAFAGDPAADFAATPSRAAMLPGSEATFVAGYQSVRPFDAEHSYRAKLYRLFLWLEGAVHEANQHNRAGVAAALAQMVELLSELERRALI